MLISVDALTEEVKIGAEASRRAAEEARKTGAGLSLLSRAVAMLTPSMMSGLPSVPDGERWIEIHSRVDGVEHRGLVSMGSCSALPPSCLFQWTH